MKEKIEVLRRAIMTLVSMFIVAVVAAEPQTGYAVQRDDRTRPTPSQIISALACSQ